MSDHKLIPVRMKKADMKLPEVQEFRCGSEPHEIPLAEWIKKHSADQINCGTKVWLYRLESNEGPLVGYGSFANSHIMGIREDGSKERINVYSIPNLALHKKYWGQPRGVADTEDKYSRQIVRHLQWHARERKGEREHLLVLYFHPKANHAEDLYTACGFVRAPGLFLEYPDVDPEDGPGLLGMVYKW